MTTSSSEMHFQWQLTLHSSPEQLWTFVADTDRLNRDIGFSEITLLDNADVTNNRKRAQQVIMGRLVQEWTEEPFQWVRPYLYSTLRNYTKGIFQYIRQQADLNPLESGGTELMYQIWVQPKYRCLSFFIRRSFNGLPFVQLFEHYDQMIQSGDVAFAPPPFTTRGFSDEDIDAIVRSSNIRKNLINMGAKEPIVERLLKHLNVADDLSLINIRPYALADIWHMPRREVLEACLIGTRVGLLDMSWDLLCPLCRSRKDSVSNLSDVGSTVHCETCQIDYTANFEQSVELTFKPNASIRTIETFEYCVGGPEVTPHIQVQQLLAPAENIDVQVNLAPGRYRVRTVTERGGKYFRVWEGNQDALHVQASELDGRDSTEPDVVPTVTLRLTNDTDSEQLFITEHLRWTDKAVTAAEVTTRQVFRDLFSSEVLRQNEKVSVGSLTILFTDLRGSTQMFQEIGDAPAFGLVLQHFDVLREAIQEHDGAIVKTIGDAVMAVFQQPDNALKAMFQAQATLRTEDGIGKALALRVGIHTGKCIAVTLNDRLDYFGTTVNTAARLEGLSSGGDIVISDAVFTDPAVKRFLKENQKHLHVAGFQEELKGISGIRHKLWRLAPIATTLPAEGR